MQIPYLPVYGRKLPRVMGGNIGSRKEICEDSGLPIPMDSIFSKAMVISKGSYGHEELKNLIHRLVQIPYLAERRRKLPRIIGGNIGPTMEICRSSGLPIPMLPRLHQSNGYIKKKLRAWRVQKCIALVGADTILTSAGSQTTPCHWE